MFSCNYKRLKLFKNDQNLQDDLFRVELSRIVKDSHPLVRLAKTLERERLEVLFAKTCSEDIWASHHFNSINGGVRVFEIHV